MNIFTTVIYGVKEVLKDIKYKLLFVGVALFIFFLFVLIPSISVEGNSFFYQLSLFRSLDFFVIIFLSLIYALFVTMQIYIFRRNKKIAGVGTAVGGSIGTIAAGVTGTAFCASCLVPLFALFGVGFGGVLFILEYRFYFVTAIIILMFIAIYFISKKIQKICNNC